MKKVKILNILVPILILVFIAGIWFIKNQKGTSKVTETIQSEQKDADFILRETKAIDFEALFSYGLPIIIDYGADSCIPCKAMAPVLEKANAVFEGKAFIKFINVWDYPDAANNVPVQVIPTQVIFDSEGKPFIPSEELAGKIQFNMYSTRDTGEHVFTVHQGGLTEEQMWAILNELGVSE